MSNYKPTTRHLREVILYYFNNRKSSSEAHRMLLYAYGNGIISRGTCSNWYQSFEKGDFNLDKPTSRPLITREQEIEELLRWMLEDPGITQAEIAGKYGISQSKVSALVNSQEFNDKLKETGRDLKLEKITSRNPRREWEDKELVRLIHENPDISQRKLAKQLGLCQSTVSNRLKSLEIQNKLKEKGQRSTSKTPRREKEDKELVRLIHENPDITPRKLAEQLGFSRATVNRRLNSLEIQNKLKEKGQRSTLKTPRREREDKELVRLMNENPDITQRKLTEQLGLGLATVNKRINSPPNSGLISIKGILHQGNKLLFTGMLNLNVVVQAQMMLNALVA
ncbi:PREDICTED: uncharacterized protein LOC107073325 [Polistes dominula]|uniref:Uncharacterized protein LOC107073325 n=1 Tax=Polistes dominula TaxID=743375 RepID=A0ABM1JAB7_POLDO|nr:PREDICTED: uncharacterized protein LOC107073325 [Polistes dominula]